MVQLVDPFDQLLVLAKKLAVSNGGKTLMITIRPNVKWSDGRR